MLQKYAFERQASVLTGTSERWELFNSRGRLNGVVFAPVTLIDKLTMLTLSYSRAAQAQSDSRERIKLLCQNIKIRQSKDVSQPATVFRRKEEHYWWQITKRLPEKLVYLSRSFSSALFILLWLLDSACADPAVQISWFVFICDAIGRFCLYTIMKLY